MSDNPMYDALHQLVVDRRLTGENMAFDDIPLKVEGDADVDDDTRIIWRDDGFSVQQTEWGGRMCKDVEQVRKYTTNEDARKELPQYFVQVAQMDDATSDQAKFVARKNAEYVHMIRRLTGYPTSRSVARMQEYSPAYYVKGTTDPEWRDLPRYEVTLAPRGPRAGAYIPNHRVCTAEAWDFNDVWTADEMGEWARKWVERYNNGSLGPEVV